MAVAVKSDTVAMGQHGTHARIPYGEGTWPCSPNHEELTSEYGFIGHYLSPEHLFPTHPGQDLTAAQAGLEPIMQLTQVDLILCAVIPCGYLAILLFSVRCKNTSH